MGVLLPAAAGIITPTLDGVIYLVAQSTTFQTNVNVTTALDARNAIYWHEARDAASLADPITTDELNTTDPRPRAIVNMPRFGRYRSGPGNWSPRGEIHVSFEFLVAKELIDDFKTQSRWFLNQIGAIVQEITDASGSDDGAGLVYANISKMELVQEPGPCDFPTECNYFWGATYNLGWPN